MRGRSVPSGLNRSAERVQGSRGGCPVRARALGRRDGEAHAPPLREGRLSRLRVRRRAGHAAAVRARAAVGQPGHAPDAREAPHPAHRPLGPPAPRRAGGRPAARAHALSARRAIGAPAELAKESVANVSEIVTLDKTDLTERTGKLPRAKLELVLSGLDVVLGR